MTQERWKPVLGYEGLYEVSDLGRIRSIDRIVPTCHPTGPQPRRGKVLKPWTKAQSAPYLHVHLSRESQRKAYRVHRLVLDAFVSPRPDGMVGCHNDGNPQNNALSNLRWDTVGSNNRDLVRHGTHYQAKKTHCPSGHPYSGENLRFYRNGGIPRRRCLACSRALDARQAEKRKAAKDRAEAAA